MQYSFYGGQQGKSFEISQIFQNKVALAGDIKARWASSIGVGEFVIVSYGLQGITEKDEQGNDVEIYAKNLNEDMQHYRRSYNSTLWQKIYVEEGAIGEVYSPNTVYNFELVFPEEGSTYGLAYKLVAAMVGSTPKFIIEDTEILPPQSNPDVTINNDSIDNPKLKFHLPRSAYMIWGNQLGQKSEMRYQVAVSNFNGQNFKAGDYYINENTGYVYIVIEVTDANIIFEYLGCMRAPLPQIEVKGVNPYNNGTIKTEFSASSVFENPTEETGWKINLEIPSAPTPQAVVELIAPDGEPSIDVSPSGDNIMKFNFQIPRGSRIFSGNLVTQDRDQTTIADAKNGDIYLNNELGSVFILQDGIWIKQEGNLKGPEGNSLNIVLKLSFDSNTYPNVNDSNSNVLNQVIENEFVAKIGRLPNPDELIAITWTDKTTDIPTDFSYWYFYTENSAGEKQWDRATITGNVAGFFFDSYNNSNEASEKGYTATYTNNLIVNGDILNTTDREQKTFSAAYINALVNGLIVDGEITEVEEQKKKTFSANYINQKFDEIGIVWGEF